MAQRWGQGAFGVAVVLTFLSLSPLMCSAWSDEREFVEHQGNSSFLCKSSGPCISCSHSEKEANKFHCRATGYHQSVKCLEMKTVQKMEQNEHGVQHLSGDAKSGKDRQSTGLGGRKLLETPVLKLEGGLKMYNSFRSCTPAELRMDRFTVLQFEGMAIASFALCSPLVYYRRKYSFSGMTRVPANPRF